MSEYGLKQDCIYYVRINDGCCLVYANDLEEAIKSIRSMGCLIIKDIAGNFISRTWSKEEMLCYQVMYQIESLILK